MPPEPAEKAKHNLDAHLEGGLNVEWVKFEGHRSSHDHGLAGALTPLRFARGSERRTSEKGRRLKFILSSRKITVCPINPAVCPLSRVASIENPAPGLSMHWKRDAVLLISA
jgi:hypothetical protein